MAGAGVGNGALGTKSHTGAGEGGGLAGERSRAEAEDRGMEAHVICTPLLWPGKGCLNGVSHAASRDQSCLPPLQGASDSLYRGDRQGLSTVPALLGVLGQGGGAGSVSATAWGCSCVAFQ
ncbi:cAMP-dependent protein kinase catalytic subunit alpha [Platysternon megacephalum]|uniref:cAMP-dependent protein kinase catalytic subunit alpha n=1 Tax=Platysternon megacephalum TaxID=55544 RepID=A0A4D9DRQ9_9SAUR|nr:cAMP-dependent protein kinase catalytic subunit alpha [Platysternon megacephalum]